MRERVINAIPGYKMIAIIRRDLHRPGVCAGIPGHYRKVVVKINVDLL